jgi:alpha-L-arabinofuranosidase
LATNDSKYAGDTVVESETRVATYDVHRGQVFAPEIPGVPYLDVLATSHSGDRQIAVFVVNRSPGQSQPCDIRLQSFTGQRDVKVVTLAGPSLLSRNDEEHPQLVRPMETHAAMSGATLRHTFPAGSVTVLLFPEVPKP